MAHLSLKEKLRYWQARYLCARLHMLFFAYTQRHPEENNTLELATPDAENFFKLTVGIPQIERQRRLMLDRFAAGDKACLVIQNNRTVHISWWGERNRLSPEYELGPDCQWPLPEKSPVIYDCWTAHEARGKGLYPKVLMQLSNRLLDNYPSVWIYCLDSNLASRRGIEKAGFKYRGTLTRTRLFGKFLKCSRDSEN